MSVTIAFGHATGFCGAVWRPVIAELEATWSTLAWDFPNHGNASQLPSPVDWWEFGKASLDQIAGLGGPVIGVGHSMGGAALVMAEILTPNSFAALILIEPMVFPSPYRRAENHLSRAVRKRKRRFDSREAARDNFASKTPFNEWHPAALDGYVDEGLIDTDDDVVLACSPEAESDIYEGATAHGAWERLASVGIPTLILAGAESDVFPPEYVRLVAAQFPRAGSEIVPGANHFMPMENPGLLARRIARVAEGIERVAEGVDRGS